MKKVLIIEANEDLRDNISEILENAGHCVLKANNGINGFVQAAIHMPDLILCQSTREKCPDCYFNKMIKNNQEMKNIPIVYTTEEMYTKSEGDHPQLPDDFASIFLKRCG